MRVALCQIDTTVGDLDGNRSAIKHSAQQAHAEGADLAVFCELAITGYPPRDLLERPAFVDAGLHALDALARELPRGLAVLVGFVDRRMGTHKRLVLHNAAALLRDGRIDQVFHKRLLPTYDVFDEDRYFEPGELPMLFDHASVRCAVTVCEDAWNDAEGPLRRVYSENPIDSCFADGAELLLNLAASPFTLQKRLQRSEMLAGIAQRYARPVVFVNALGGNDDLIFDGGSSLYGSDGEVWARAASFTSDLVICELTRAAGDPPSGEERPRSDPPAPAAASGGRPYSPPPPPMAAERSKSTPPPPPAERSKSNPPPAAPSGIVAEWRKSSIPADPTRISSSPPAEWRKSSAPPIPKPAPRPPQHGLIMARGPNTNVDVLRPAPASAAEAALAALTLGTRDYAYKCGFHSAVLGLSGGIDSALVACIAARALGAENVLGVAMPTRYSSPASREDAEALARALGIHFRVIDIDPLFQRYLDDLGPALAELSAPKEGDTTLENIQARIRGTTLMAISNRAGHLLLTTGNKSELAVGYTTLYGDMAGGLGVIADLPKTVVYEVAREYNRQEARAIIPESVFSKPPSAELRPDQTDQDTLPPYDQLDAVIERLIERGMSVQSTIADGFAPDVVQRVAQLVRTNEYKRRQMPTGLIVTSKAFGPGRRYPIAQRFRG
jgi:NAD+ synthase (glutamine-hydrolysing)